MTPTQRPYQVAASEALESAFFDQGQNRLLVKKPTGAGKTVWFAGLLTRPRIAEWLATFPAQERKMLVIAHREELIDQAAEKIKAANPGLMVMVEQADRMASVYADVVVASIQTLSARKFARLHRLTDRTTFRLVVVDEAHHAAARTYRAALAHLGFLPHAPEEPEDDTDAATYDDVEAMAQSLVLWDQQAPKDRLLVGVTATPNRSDAVGLGCVFQSIAFSYDLKRAIEDQWLVPIQAWSIETATSLDAVKLNRGDFNQRQLADTVNTPERNAVAVAAWEEYAPGQPTLGFTVDVAHAHDLSAAFEARGHRWVAISGETPTEDRRRILRQYTEGQIDGIANCMLLTEGTDLPRTGCILHAKPTKSATLYEQMTGRGLRLFPGKQACVVIDIVDVARRHSLQNAPVLYGLPPGVLTKGTDLRQAEAEFEELLGMAGFDADKALTGQHLTLEQLRQMATAVNVWQPPDMGEFGRGRQMAWVRVSDGGYRMQYPWGDGTEVISVEQDLVGRWSVVLTMRPRDTREARRQRTLAAQVTTAEAAADLAEGYIQQERRSVTKLKSHDAGWMKNPATPKQIAKLKYLGVRSVPAGLTAGQASYRIDIELARKGQ